MKSCCAKSVALCSIILMSLCSSQNNVMMMDWNEEYYSSNALFTEYVDCQITNGHNIMIIDFDYMCDSEMTGSHYNPSNTCSKSIDDSDCNYTQQNTTKTVQKLANLRCNDSNYMEYQCFDVKPGTITLESKNWDSPETSYFGFDDASNEIFFLFVSLAIFFFCGAFVYKPSTSHIVLQMFACLLIHSVTAIDLNFELADYSLPYNNWGAAYGTTSDNTMYIIGGSATSTSSLTYRRTVVKWNPSVGPSSFTTMVLDTAPSVICYGQCAAMIKAYDGHEYLFIISTNNYNVLIFNTTSDTFVDHTIAATSTKWGCVSTDGVSKIYYSGGESTTQMSVLDVSTSIVGATWETLQSATNGRGGQYCFYANGVHYDIGGGQTDSWKYNVIANDWTEMDFTFDAVYAHGTTIYWSKAGVALLLGGRKSNRGQKVSFIFDPSTETMTELYGLQVARSYNTLSIVDDTLYVLCGWLYRHASTKSIEYADLYTLAPTPAPTGEPTAAPTNGPTNEPTAAPTSDCTGCEHICETYPGCVESDNYNIVFVLDESGSVTSINYEITLDFVQTLIADDVNDDSKVAVITFSDDQETLYSLVDPQNDDRVSVIAILETEKDDANYDGRTTDTLNAVIAGIDEIKENGDITQNILVLITDGTPTCVDDPDCVTNVCNEDLINDIQYYGVKVVIIGVTDAFDGAEVSCLSSDIIEIEEYTSAYFESIQDDIRDVTCTSDGGESAARTNDDNIDEFKYIKSVSGRDRWSDLDLIVCVIMSWICCSLCCYSLQLSKTKKSDPVVYDSVDRLN